MKKNSNNLGNLPKYIKQNPNNASIISKLNTDTKNIGVNLLEKAGDLNKITKFTKDKLLNNDTILKLFPEIELSIQILTSSILSPNDMLTVNTIYNTNDIKLPSDIINTLNSIVKDYMDKVYHIDDDLPEILRESIFTKGSYIKAILPESIIDEVINKDIYDNIALEDIDTELFNNTKFNYLSDITDKTISLESDDYSITYTKSEIEQDIVITDNLDYLNLKNIKKEKAEILSKEQLGIESTDTDLEDDILRFFKTTPIIDDKNLDPTKKDSKLLELGDETSSIRSSVTQPLIIKLPVESVIPVHIAGDPKTHLGYFVILDSNGNPVSIKNSNDDNKKQTYGSSNKSSILNKANDAIKGLTKKAPTLDKLEEIYSELIDRQLRKRLNNGIFKNLADFEETQHIYRTMFTRVLKGQKTTMLFIPATIVSFYAFKYRDNGTGEPLLESIGTIASMRAILLFSRLMANIKNSITDTNITVELDNDDPDPEKTKEIIVSEVLKNRQLELPIGINTLDDLVDWSHSVGFRFNFKHESLPDINIDVSQDTSSIATPDEELETNLKEYMIKSFGLSPEMVDNSNNADFATTVVAQNLLLAKRVSQMQNQLNPQITDNIKKILKTDAIAKDMIRYILTSNLKEIKKYIKKISKDNVDIFNNIKNENKLIDFLVEYYIDNLIIKLPKPEMFQDDNLKEAFSNYKDSVEEYIDMMLSEEALPEEFIGDMAENLDVFKDMVKNTLLRKWSSDNNYLPDIHKMITLDSDGRPVFDVLSDFMSYKNNLGTVLIEFLKKNKKYINDLNKKYEKIDSEEEEDNTDEPTEDDNADNGGDNTDVDIDNNGEEKQSNDTQGDGGDDLDLDDDMK